MAKRPASDLTVLKKWFATLDDADFLTLAPPSRSRFTQSDGREDAGAELADRAMSATTPYAFWHWQSHQRAFTSKGELVDDLLVHWQGPHDDVARRLAAAPAPFTVVDAGADQAFVMTKPFPLPPIGDRRATGPTIRRLVRTVAVGKDVTGDERDWLLAVAEGTGDAAEDAFAVACDLGVLTRDLVTARLADWPGPDDEDLAGTWLWLTAVTQVVPEALADLVTAHAAHPLAAAVLGEPVADLDTDADDALAVSAARLWQARDTDEAVAAVAPWLRREHLLSTVEEVVWLLALRLYGGVHRDVAPARLLDLAGDERLPLFWRGLAVSVVDSLGGHEHLADRLDAVRVLGPRPFSAYRPADQDAPVIDGDRARLRELAADHWQLGSQPTTLRTNPDRTRTLAATADFPLGWFWTWPAEQAAFDRDGRMSGPLPVHLIDATADDIRESLPPRFVFVTEPPAIHPGDCPPLEDILDGFAGNGPASHEDLDYLRATYLRYDVQGQPDTVDSQRAATLFEVWRVHDGARVPGAPSELLDTRTARALVDRIYAPGGLAERTGHGDGFPFLPFARDVGTGELHYLDMRLRIPPVHTADPDTMPDGAPVAPNVDLFLAERVAVAQ